jgi:predicted acetyltransferase
MSHAPSSITAWHDAAMTEAETLAAQAWHIRSPGPGELRDFMTPLPLAFAEEINETELTEWEEVIEPDRWIGAFESATSSQALGSATAYSERLTVPGGEVAAAAVSGVGVRPDQRRRGILTALMRHQLEDVRGRGEPLAVLWASEGAIYQRFGYGQATLDGAIEVDVLRSAYRQASPSEGRVRLLTTDEALATFPPVYEAMRAVTPGALSRSATWWRIGPLSDPEQRRSSAGVKYRALFEADGSAEGYALYRVKDDWDHRGPKHVLDVSEAVTTTPRALRELWRFLFEVDLVRTVKASRMAIPSPLQLIMAEPRTLSLVAKDGLWLRLVDLPAALARRSYATADSIVIEVSDDFCPWNAGRWRLDATKGPGAVASVERSDATPELILDTTDLAAMYLGALRASHLALAGRVVERTAGALVRADALFVSGRTPWCVSMF